MLKSFLTLRPLAFTSIMPFYYSVIGRHAGIYNTWDEAKACTNGVSGARCKKFKTLKEAEDFLAEHNHEFYSTEQLSENRVEPKTSAPYQSEKRTASKIFLKNKSDFSAPVAVKKKFVPNKFSSYDELARRLGQLNQRKWESPKPNVPSVSSPLSELNDSQPKRSRSPSDSGSSENGEGAKRRRLMDVTSTTDSDANVNEVKLEVSPKRPSRVVEVISSSDSESNENTDLWGDDDVFEEVPEFLLKAEPTGSSPADSSSSVSFSGHSGFPVEFKYNDKGMVMVFTDGACTNNGHSGAQAGVGVWFNHNHPLNVSEPVEGPATNNNAEIQAATRAMQQALKAGIKLLDINTDSQFLIQCMTQWIYKWKKNNWQLSAGGLVKNKEKLVEADRTRNLLKDVKFTHVTAHCGIEGNEAADYLARQGALAYKPSDSSKDRKKRTK